ncbi:hypothetical protein Lesp02_13320 [Lentzea sp. NBRC 105346]|nr:hypothetical protein Lesp02_13320 [Lentzea sp. NBRC 105346]
MHVRRRRQQWRLHAELVRLTGTQWPWKPQGTSVRNRSVNDLEISRARQRNLVDAITQRDYGPLFDTHRRWGVEPEENLDPGDVPILLRLLRGVQRGFHETGEAVVDPATDGPRIALQAARQPLDPMSEKDVLRVGVQPQRCGHGQPQVVRKRADKVGDPCAELLADDLSPIAIADTASLAQRWADVAVEARSVDAPAPTESLELTY